jgi:hypothetical protein
MSEISLTVKTVSAVVLRDKSSKKHHSLISFPLFHLLAPAERLLYSFFTHFLRFERKT